MKTNNNIAWVADDENQSSLGHLYEHCVVILKTDQYGNAFNARITYLCTQSTRFANIDALLTDMSTRNASATTVLATGAVFDNQKQLIGIVQYVDLSKVLNRASITAIQLSTTNLIYVNVDGTEALPTMYPLYTIRKVF